MNIEKTKTFQATINIGLEVGYTNNVYDKEQLIKELQAYQEQKINNDNVYLSASVIECNIVLNGQNEKHLKLEFINYPKFVLAIEEFKAEVFSLAKYLLMKMKQNRTVVVFTDETIMLEINKEIDPKI
tara:strand:- start:622 stop:1005 length:384 start_codon:yes stop_codon:yes gene_type:complete